MVLRRGQKNNNEYMNFIKSNTLEGSTLLKAELYTFKYKKHVHEEYAIAVTERGVQSFSCNNTLYKVPTYGIITINPYEVHDGYSELESGLEYEIIYISQKIIDEMVKEIWGGKNKHCFFNKTVNFDYTLAYILMDLFRLINKEKDNLLELKSKFYEVISRLLINHGTLSNTPKYIKKDNYLIKRACEYIYDNADKKLSLDDISKEVNLSTFYFARLFKKTTGLSPHSYLTQRRVELAKNTIAKGVDLSEAARTSGFSDQSHMNRRFKEVYGVTPGKYKKSIIS